MRSGRTRALMASLACVVLALGGSAPASRADTLVGSVRAPGHPAGPVVFRWRLVRGPGGVWRSWYRTPTGEVAAEDEVKWDGTRLREYRYVRHNTGERAQAARRGQELVIVQDLGGRHREAREPWDDAVTVGPTVILHIQRRWADLAAGRALTVRYVLLDQLRSFRFTLRRAARPGAPRGDRVVIRMSPDHPLYRFFVGPSELEFSADGRRLHAIRGRLLPVVPRGPSFRAFQGELTVEGDGGSGPGVEDHGPGDPASDPRPLHHRQQE